MITSAQNMSESTPSTLSGDEGDGMLADKTLAQSKESICADVAVDDTQGR